MIESNKNEASKTVQIEEVFDEEPREKISNEAIEDTKKVESKSTATNVYYDFLLKEALIRKYGSRLAEFKYHHDKGEGYATFYLRTEFNLATTNPEHPLYNEQNPKHHLIKKQQEETIDYVLENANEK